MREELRVKGALAQEAAYNLGLLSREKKDAALYRMAEALEKNAKNILAANQLDMQKAEKAGVSKAFLDRLKLTDARISDMALGLKAIAELDDPIGKADESWLGAEDIQISKVRVPLGVIGIIYEARPNVTADAAGLCLKSGNAAFLRGGSDAFNSNKEICRILAEAAEACGIPHGAIQLVEDTSRECVNEMLKLNEYLDVLIPRGGAGLIRNVVENSTVPVIQTGVGNCHIYIDDAADIEMALNIAENGKLQRPGVCNALETLLVHRDIADEFLPRLAERLGSVEFRACERSQKYLPQSKTATAEDYACEFHDLILAVKTVDSIEEAVAHIRQYSTKHSEVIVTNNYAHARLFTARVDAACVYVNASSRFSDGFQFGFGAEIGISTQKLHARGPMGLKELTSYKYVINGSGQVRK